MTAALIGAVLATAVEQRVFGSELTLDSTYQWGFSGSGLLAGRWSTIFTSQLLTRNAFMALSIPVSLAVMLGAYEALAGTIRAAIVAAASAVAGPGIVTVVAWVGSSLNIEFASRTLETLDYGASAVTAGAGGALVAVVQNRRLTLIAVLFVLSGIVVHHELADWEHIAAFPVGLAIGAGLARKRTNQLRTPTSPSGRVARRSPLEGAAITVVAAAVGWTAAAGALPGPDNATAGASTTPEISAQRLVDVRYPTPSLGGDRRVLVLLPRGYDSSPLRYPVVEILHGRPGGPDDIFTSMSLLSTAPTVAPFIAVVPDGHGPVVSDGDFADTSRQHLGAALGDDLQSWIDSAYRTDRHWSGMGISSGGYGVAYLGTRPGSRFAAVCAIGGNFTAQDPPFAGEPKTVRDAASPILHASPRGPRTLLVAAENDGEAVGEAQRYSAALGVAGEVHDLVVVKGNHDWDFFRTETPRCLRYLLPSR